MSLYQYCMLLLTLGVHAQRGLQYLVCVSVCVCVSTTILGLQATGWLMSDTNSFGATRARKKCGDFAEMTAFEKYGV